MQATPSSPASRGGCARLPIAFGRLVKRELDAAEWNSIITPLKDAGVRRDLAKVLKGISTKYTVQSARDLERFEHPTLFLWADTTKLFPIENARRLASRMPDAHVVSRAGKLRIQPAGSARILWRNARAGRTSRIIGTPPRFLRRDA